MRREEKKITTAMLTENTSFLSVSRFSNLASPVCGEQTEEFGAWLMNLHIFSVYLHDSQSRLLAWRCRRCWVMRSRAPGVTLVAQRQSEDAIGLDDRLLTLNGRDSWWEACLFRGWTGTLPRQQSCCRCRDKASSYRPLCTWAQPSRPYLWVWAGATRPGGGLVSGPRCLLAMQPLPVGGQGWGRGEGQTVNEYLEKSMIMFSIVGKLEDTL